MTVPPPPGDDAEGESLSLGRLLKVTGLVETGGHAKRLIQDGLVKVNGEVERRRKRLVQAGDVIEIGGESFVVEALDEPESDAS